MWRGSLIDVAGMVAVLVAEGVIFACLERRFLTADTFSSIVNQAPDTIIVAVGMTFVLILAEIDLSVGSVLALTQAVLGYCLASAVGFEWPLPAAILACLTVGTLCGMMNGFVTVRLRSTRLRLAGPTPSESEATARKGTMAPEGARKSKLSTSAAVCRSRSGKRTTTSISSSPR